MCVRGLLSSVQHCAELVGATDKQEPILKCFRSLESIFKFIVESRLLFSRANHGQYEESFSRDLYAVFAALNSVLAATAHSVLATQVSIHLPILTLPIYIPIKVDLYHGRT